MLDVDTGSKGYGTPGTSGTCSRILLDLVIALAFVFDKMFENGPSYRFPARCRTRFTKGLWTVFCSRAVARAWVRGSITLCSVCCTRHERLATAMMRLDSFFSDSDVTKGAGTLTVRDTGD